MKKKLLIAGLISLLAILCGAARAGAQQAPATEIAGGPGGKAYSDPEPERGTRVIEVQVRAGDHVDSVQLLYMQGDGRTVAGPQHGGGGGSLNVFHLDADEYLIGISGRSGDFVDSIRFETNKRTSPTFGGKGGNRDFRIEVPANAQVSGLVGRSGQFLDAVGLAFTPIRRRFISPFGSEPQPGQTSMAGGPGGADFLDDEIPDEAHIVEVRVEAGEYIDSIQMIYGFPGSRPTEGARHGGEGGRVTNFRLEPGEYIVGISGRYGKYLDSLRIHTNMRTSQLFGGNGGDREYRIEVPEGNQAVGFMGRSGMYIDAIGLIYARTHMRENEFHDGRRGR